MKFEATDYTGDRLRVHSEGTRLVFTALGDEKRVDVVLDAEQTKAFKMAILGDLLG
jgi:hypothetical protein